MYRIDYETGDRHEYKFTDFTIQDNEQVRQGPQFSSRLLTDTDEQGDVQTQAPSNYNQLGIQWPTAPPRVITFNETVESLRERWYRIEQASSPRGPIGSRCSDSDMDYIFF
jgi:hypothetical protein